MKEVELNQKMKMTQQEPPGLKPRLLITETSWQEWTPQSQPAMSSSVRLPR
jgi:hypothetical protein